MSEEVSANEGMKSESRGLRGTLSEGMENQISGGLDAVEQQIIKFHGSYQQDNRDRRADRERKKLEWAFSYMVRLRLPGGDISADQWLKIQESCDENASGTVKITTRQTIQFHGIVKARMKPTMKDFDALGLDGIAACGDVNRNVMCGSNPALAPYHPEVFEYADKISTHLLPKTKAYQEVWLDGKKLPQDVKSEEDPLYGESYLPRKFKISIALPPHNENDVFSQDVGLIAIGEGNEFLGFNLAIGGGMGATHGNPATYPRCGTLLGFVPKENVLNVLWHIVAIQRDHGDRLNRKAARLKYTVDRLGVEWFTEEIERRSEHKFEELKPYTFSYRGDPFGWVEDFQGLWHYGIFVESGLIRDVDGYDIKSGLIEIAQQKKCGIRFTGNQNLMLTNIDGKDRSDIEALLTKHGISHEQYSNSRKEAIACVALPTCPLALAEGQRYLPSLITKIDLLQDKHGIADLPISIRMTGCPNGCGRPYLAEIGLVGKAAGKYALRLGGDYEGERLNQIYKEEADEKQILDTLDILFGEFGKKRKERESFGDYVHRTHFNGKIFIGKNQEKSA